MKVLSLAMCAVFFVMAGVFAAEGRNVGVVFEGEVAKGMKVYDFGGQEYLSVNQIAKVYGARVVWHPITGKTTLFMNNKSADIYIKSTRYVIAEKKRYFDSPTRSASGDVYVPLEFVLTRDFADFSETSSSWSAETKILTIDKKINIVTPRFYSHPDKTQIVIENLENLPFEWSAKTPGKVVVSFPRGRAAKENIGVDDGIVKEIEIKNTGRQAQIALYLTAGAGKPEKQVLADPARIVIDIPRTALAEKDLVTEIEKTAPVVLAAAVPLPPPSPEAAIGPAVIISSVPAVAALPEKKRQPAVKTPAAKKKLVILDAGHGGEDTGAIGRNGTKEKDINLAIVRELKRLFEDNEEYDTLLTRTDDTFIPLVERTMIANEKKADLFVSVHCNAAMGKNSNGFEIYFLSEKASDPEAAATAILENSVIRLENKPTKKQSRLQELLWSMVVNEYINEASELCSLVTGEVMKRIKIENRGVKQAGFYVLRGAQMPAVLVECAFISHIGEEAKLKSKKFQRQIADSIYEGVKNYGQRKDNKNVASGKKHE